MHHTPASLDETRNYVRAANYLSAAQIYLQDNFLLERPLTTEDIKPRLLGHWGTCPGINFAYAHLNRLIHVHDLDMMFVLGPGHGFPAIQANLYLEGTLSKFYPEVTEDEAGLGYMCRNFSWPYGFPSHSNPGTPGVILEGGELGYSLATAYGAAMDNPDLIVAAMVGDGEAETGPTATAWHLNKLLDPHTNGVVLPILHLNGYKISGPTIFGRMSDDELCELFSGYGYEPHIVDSEASKDVHQLMADTLEKAYASIKTIKARGASPGFARLPMIVLRTPKGWTGIKELHGQRIEGNHLSHQVVGMEARTNPEEFEAISKWLKSYKFTELFDAKTGFIPELRAARPARPMGENHHIMQEGAKLKLPAADQFAEDATVPGTIGSSSMKRAGMMLNEVMAATAQSRNFRLLSPDETYSNKLDAVFQTTARASAHPQEAWDLDMAPDGRVVEMLSEHTLQGLLQGYVLTGRHAVFASYEAFIQIVSSMVDQYAKFIRVATEIPWRPDVSSLNYILTSSGWRQEHNGFSHQNPGFIDDMLHRQGDFVQVYFPPDANSTLVTLRHCLESRNGINVLVAGKTEEPRWLTSEQAEELYEKGMAIWDFASDKDPDIVLAAAGDYLTKETLAAIDLLKTEIPEARLRFVSILTVSALGFDDAGRRLFTKERFNELFTADKPVVFNFHGYPQTLKQFLFDYEAGPQRFSVHGYQESGSTTTPFDMHVRNGTSRYQLLIEIVPKLAAAGRIDQATSDRIVAEYQQKLQEHRLFIIANGIDPENIENWQWTR